MRKFIAFLLLGLVLVLAPNASAVGGPVSATYSGDWTTGQILLQSQSDACGFFRVRAEQPDGTYMLVGQGVLPAHGAASVAVTGGGVEGNDLPAWIVEYRQPDGTTLVLAVAGANDDSKPWGWE
ncbi:MAG: hypothetical protein IT460_05470 [Planctomycetes bacterium]|nr:hypothetical protein [Planctomycetota bacterium]